MQRVHPQISKCHFFFEGVNVAPWSAADERRVHPDRAGGQYVVVEAITHIQDALGGNLRFGDQPVEERGVWLGYTPCIDMPRTVPAVSDQMRMLQIG